VLHDFELAGRRVRLWQRAGESYEHVLMKALGYAMFVGRYPQLEIERRVGLRYKPDLVALSDAPARGEGRRFPFWGECGMVTVRKVAWLLKHGDIERLAVFKMTAAPRAWAEEVRAAVEPRHRQDGRAVLVNFVSDIVERTRTRRVARVPEEWYTLVPV
jgi:hypothetical protein